MPVQPSSAEEEHFAKIEYEKRKAAAEKRRKEMAAEERAKEARLHHMRCPKCGDELAALRMSAVEVDKCPSCSGMWLDAGELEQLVDRDGGGALKRMLGIFK